ncbi:hypothetical protein COE51_01610 [Bacillus pseudomycoides]|nr:hypothetical protein COE51_01610 [Bacillus pseudomycoides]
MIIIRGEEKLEQRDLFLAKTKVKALLYSRVSSDDQTNNYSLESQIDACSEYAMSRLGLKEDELIAFVEEGEMGDNPDRPALNYMLKLLKDEDIGEVVIIYDSDRLARDNFLQRFILNQIIEANATLKIVRDEAFDPFDENSMLSFNIKGALAEYMKKKILSESKRGRMTKVKKHKQMMGINRIYGYVFDKENDILVINEEEKEVILNIVDMLLVKNMSCSQIARQLSKDGISAPKGSVWYQATLSRMLKNEAYKGTFYYGQTEVVQVGGKKKQIPVPKDRWIEIPIPAIYDEATFHRIQLKLGQLQRNHSGRPSDNLLKGLAKCAKCGGAIYIASKSGSGKNKIKYYGCVRKHKSGYKVGTGERHATCKSSYWRQDVVDDLVWKQLVARLNSPDQIIEDILKQQGDLQKAGNLFKKRKDFEKKIEEQEVIKDRYFDLYAMGRIKTQDELDKKLEPIEEMIQNIKVEMEILDEQLKYITASYDELELLKTKVNEYKNLIQTDNVSHEYKKEIVKLFVKKVVLHEEEIELHTTWSVNVPAAPVLEVTR